MGSKYHPSVKAFNDLFEKSEFMSCPCGLCLGDEHPLVRSTICHDYHQQPDGTLSDCLHCGHPPSRLT